MGERGGEEFAQPNHMMQNPHTWVRILILFGVGIYVCRSTPHTLGCYLSYAIPACRGRHSSPDSFRIRSVNANIYAVRLCRAFCPTEYIECFRHTPAARRPTEVQPTDPLAGLASSLRTSPAVPQHGYFGERTHALLLACFN